MKLGMSIFEAHPCRLTWHTASHGGLHDMLDSEGIRTPAGRAQWISSPSP